MKTKAQPSPVSPAHDHDLSVAVEPYRHEKTGRTVGRIQDAGNDTDSHLFSATGIFIETVKTTTITKHLPKKKVAAPEPPPAAT